MRSFPIRPFSTLKGKRRAWMKQIRQALEELEQFRSANQGWLFPFKHAQTINEALQDAKAALWKDDEEKRADSRSLRQLRHSARWMMENVLALDLYTKCDLLGHTPEVSVHHYRPDTDAQSLGEKLSR